MKRILMLLLSVMLVLSMTVPAFAASYDTSLSLHATVNGNPVSDLKFHAYRVGYVTESGDYAVTEKYIDDSLRTVLKSLHDTKLVTEHDSGATANALKAFAAYINSNSNNGSFAEYHADTGANGIATFSKLPAGIYLISSNTSYMVGYMKYTPMPFMIILPYGSVELTGSVKFTQTDTTPYIPPSGGGGTPTRPTSTPEPSDDPGNDPGGDPDDDPIVIEDEDVPQTELPDLPTDDGDPTETPPPGDAPTPTPDPGLTIEDEDIPLSELPQTGLLMWPLFVLLGIGILALLFSLFCRKTKKTRLLSLLLAFACVVTVVGIMLSDMRDSVDATGAAEQVQAQLAEVQYNTIANTMTVTPLILPTKIEAIGLASDVIPPRELTVSEIDGYGYIGTIVIPDINIELPVQEHWSYPGLKIAPGRLQGTPWDKDFVILAHSYTGHFGKLKTLSAGAKIQFIDMDGEVYDYEVDCLEIVNPSDVAYVTNGEWDLTLFTCTPGGRQRQVVRCNLITGD